MLRFNFATDRSRSLKLKWQHSTKSRAFWCEPHSLIRIRDGAHWKLGFFCNKTILRYSFATDRSRSLKLKWQHSKKSSAFSREPHSPIRIRYCAEWKIAFLRNATMLRFSFATDQSCSLKLNWQYSKKSSAFLRKPHFPIGIRYGSDWKLF